MKRGSFIALLMAGCMSVPPYVPEVAVTYSADGTGSTAAGPGFALHFAGGDGLHFPDALNIDGTDVLGHAPGSRCSDESAVGFQLLPTPRISADGGAALVSNQLTPVLRGPAVVQVKLAWGARLECSPARAPGGTSTFTVFPDGRIVRYDLISDEQTSPLTPGDCKCAPDGEDAFTISTYWTLARARFRELYAPQQRALPGELENITNEPASCVEGGTHQLAFAWPESYGTTIRANDEVIGFGRDLSFREPELLPFMWKNSSAILIGRTGCPDALVRAREQALPSALMIDGVAVMPSDRDGLYGGDRGDDSLPGIALTGDRATLTGPVGSSFAVWLRFPRSVEALHATLEGAKGAWYLPQRVDDRSWIVWFEGSISVAQTIVIEAR